MIFSRKNLLVFNEICDIFDGFQANFLTVNLVAREIVSMEKIAEYGVDVRDREAVKQAIREAVEAFPEELEITGDEGEFIIEK